MRLIESDALYEKIVGKLIENFEPFDDWYEGYVAAMCDVEVIINELEGKNEKSEE